MPAVKTKRIKTTNGRVEQWRLSAGYFKNDNYMWEKSVHNTRESVVAAVSEVLRDDTPNGPRQLIVTFKYAKAK